VRPGESGSVWCGPNLIRAPKLSRPDRLTRFARTRFERSGPPSARARIWFGLCVTGHPDARAPPNQVRLGGPNLIRAARSESRGRLTRSARTRFEGSGRQREGPKSGSAFASLATRRVKHRRIRFGSCVPNLIRATGDSRPVAQDNLRANQIETLRSLTQRKAFLRAFQAAAALERKTLAAELRTVVPHGKPVRVCPKPEGLIGFHVSSSSSRTGAVPRRGSRRSRIATVVRRKLCEDRQDDLQCRRNRRRTRWSSRAGVQGSQVSRGRSSARARFERGRVLGLGAFPRTRRPARTSRVVIVQANARWRSVEVDQRSGRSGLQNLAFHARGSRRGFARKVTRV